TTERAPSSGLSLGEEDETGSPSEGVKGGPARRRIKGVEIVEVPAPVCAPTKRAIRLSSTRDGKSTKAIPCKMTDMPSCFDALPPHQQGRALDSNPSTGFRRAHQLN